MLERQPYRGPSRKLVLAFHVGIVSSSVSYSILCPGKGAIVCGVTCFPATEHVNGGVKIPSVVYYDQEGVPQAFGAEALQEWTIETAEDENWTKHERWILHLRPRNTAPNCIHDRDIPPLPSHKTAVQILADFMGYLFRCTRTYIQETHPGGNEIWELLEDNIDFVLSHPNGWEDSQHSKIRRAAVLAGLIPDSAEGQARIQLVTYGSANLHFCLSTEKTTKSFEGDQGVMIIDAGGDTIDVSSCYITSCPHTCQEIAPPECHLEGSAFVTQRARRFLVAKLSGSKYGSPDITAQMTEIFDKKTKIRFSNTNEASYIRFGSAKDRDLAYDIRFGQLRIPGADVANLFDPSVTAIIAAIENQLSLATKPIKSIFLLGGFAANNWLFSRLQEHSKSLNLNFYRPGGCTNNAIADGAIAFYLDHKVC